MIMLSKVQLDRPVTSSGLTQADDDDDNDYLRSYVKMSKIKKLKIQNKFFDSAQHLYATRATLSRSKMKQFFAHGPSNRY